MLSPVVDAQSTHNVGDDDSSEDHDVQSALSHSSTPSTMTQAHIPAFSSSHVCDLDELDGFAYLQYPRHPTFHQPPPATITTSTIQSGVLPLPTASFPSSPPRLARSLSPYATIPLPELLPNLEGGLAIHTILNGPPSSPLLKWNVHWHPNTAVCELNEDSLPRRTHAEQRLRPRQWHNQPASTPGLDRIFIYAPIVTSGWIVVRPNDYISSVVTIYDVLLAVYQTIESTRLGRTQPEKEAKLLGALMWESGDPERQKRGAEPDRPEPWWWGGLEPMDGEEDCWRLVLEGR